MVFRVNLFTSLSILEYISRKIELKKGGESLGKLNHYNKVKYICEIYREKRFYLRQEYLRENVCWGQPRRISEETFLKRESDGFPVEYRFIDQLPSYIIEELEDLQALIDLALDTYDKEWFFELVQKREILLN